MPGSDGATIVFTNAGVHTMDAAGTVAEAVAVRGDRIAGVGRTADLLARFAGAECHDLGGATVLPGLIDSHLHLLTLGLNSFAVDLSRAASIEDVLSALSHRIGDTPAGGWILSSSRWHESQLDEGRFPTRTELDSVAPSHPVLLRRGGHNVVANSAALAAAGIDGRTPDPPGGTYVRDAAGALTGQVIGAPAFGRLVRLLPEPDEARMVEAIRFASRRLIEAGITGVVEPGLSAAEIAAFRRAYREGALGVRAVLMPRLDPGVTPASGERALAAFAGLDVAGGDGFLSVGPIKMVADGGVETNYLREPYAHADDPAAPRGKPRVSRENLAAVCRRAAEEGRQVGVHCVGDAAIDLVLDAFSEANRVRSIANLRWTLIHMTLAHSEQIERARGLGLVVAVQQPLIDALGAGWRTYWGAERAAKASPLRMFADSGLIVGAGSDAPVTDFSPWRALWSAATRDTARAGVLGVDQAVDAATTLRWYTTGSAALTHDEGTRGSIAPGMLADLIVVRPNPFAIAPDLLPSVRVALTMVDGEIVWRG